MTPTDAKLLVLNCGSSSIKFQVYTSADCEDGCKVIASGLVEKIGTDAGILKLAVGDRPAQVQARELLDHVQGLEAMFAALTDPKDGVLKDPGEITAVGHRVVHGGEHFTQSVLLTDEAIEQIRECIDLAPLHNPHNLRGIVACRQLVPRVPQVAVFDTAFHQTMQPTAYLYALPHVLYSRHKVRRYGFHGTSHLYVHARAVARARAKGSLKVITAHLGNGCSVAAIDGGRSVDTSMGMTPLEGLVMGTRCGDLDPQVVLHVMEKEELTSAQASTMMNKHSGLQGISGVSSDMRDLLKAAGEGDKRARQAVDIFCYRLRKYIGAYAAALGGLDVLVFTGGIGTFAPAVRAQSMEDLRFLGIEVDAAANAAAVVADRESTISTAGSRVEVMVIPTNEELVIARDTMRLIDRV
jgi:acetate kinase